MSSALNAYGGLFFHMKVIENFLHLEKVASILQPAVELQIEFLFLSM